MATRIVRLRNFFHRQMNEGVRLYYNLFWGMRIGKGTRISLSAKLDRTNPKGVVIGEYTFITFRTTILTHDFIYRRHMPVKIGGYCFIGCNAIIMPGVEIGDHCIVAAGALVREDVPAGCLVAGNPARIVRRNIETVKWGMSPRPGEVLPAHLYPETAGR